MHLSITTEDRLLVEIASLSTSIGDRLDERGWMDGYSSDPRFESDPGDISHELLEQLNHCVPCQTLVIQFEPDEDDTLGGSQGYGQTIRLNELERIIDATRCHRHDSHRQPTSQSSQAEIVVVNHSDIEVLADRHVAIFPIRRGQTQLGRLIAIRWRDQGEFGDAEVNLIRSILSVLSLHLMNQRQYEEMQSMLEGTVRSLASTIDAKDAYTHGHSSRVADLAVKLAIGLDMDDQTADSMHLAGILHDIGKIGIDDSVLKKPGKLTADEFDQIKKHPVLGYEILKDMRPFRHILPAVLHHHEAWDGSGYPDGLSGNAIPREAQILAVADAFDAMTSDRHYRSGLPIEKVREIFLQGRGQQWAPDVVDALMACDELRRVEVAEAVAG